MKEIFCLLLLLALPGAAQARFTVRDLQEIARANDVLFEGYVGGAAEALIISKRICPKIQVTFGAAAEMLRNDLKKLQLEELTGDGVYFVERSLSLRFKCAE